MLIKHLIGLDVKFSSLMIQFFIGIKIAACLALGLY